MTIERTVPSCPKCNWLMEKWGIGVRRTREKYAKTFTHTKVQIWECPKCLKKETTDLDHVAEEMDSDDDD